MRYIVEYDDNLLFADVTAVLFALTQDIERWVHESDAELGLFEFENGIRVSLKRNKRGIRIYVYAFEEADEQ